MYNIFQKKIYIKHYNIICASHEKLVLLKEKRNRGQTMNINPHKEYSYYRTIMNPALSLIIYNQNFCHSVTLDLTK